MIDLTLDAILIPDLTGYVNPLNFGTKITTTPDNHGGLSTLQVNNNILAPFSLMRGVSISTSEQTSEVQYDAKLILENTTGEITLTLGNGQYAGCKVCIINRTTTDHVLSCTYVAQSCPKILKKSNLNLIWNGDYWINEALMSMPIGSEYWTCKAPNDGGDPNVLFGGSWTQIKDKFVLAAGDTYSLNGTGGEATVTLTANQMPSHDHGGVTGGQSVDHTHSFDHWHDMTHTHGFSQTAWLSDTAGVFCGAGAGLFNNLEQGRTTGGASSSHTSRAKRFGSEKELTNTTGCSTDHTHTISSAGGNLPHNNMPPYIVKYCWERTA